MQEKLSQDQKLIEPNYHVRPKLFESGPSNLNTCSKAVRLFVHSALLLQNFWPKLSFCLGNFRSCAVDYGQQSPSATT